MQLKEGGWRIGQCESLGAKPAKESNDRTSCCSSMGESEVGPAHVGACSSSSSTMLAKSALHALMLGGKNPAAAAQADEVATAVQTLSPQSSLRGGSRELHPETSLKAIDKQGAGP